jgi:PPOX class probable F420-dependent enzyme
VAHFTQGQRAFLDQPLSAVVATLRADGTPVQSVVWYVRDDDDTLWLSVGPASVKARHLRRDPRLSVLILSPDGLDFLWIEGTATIDEVVDGESRLRLLRRYVGDGAAAWVRQHPLPQPNMRIRLHPRRVVEQHAQRLGGDRGTAEETG